MRNCRVHREVMSSYLDGAASAAERSALETHLAECLDCRTALEELRWTTREIRRLQAVEPPPWMTAKIMARLHGGETPSVSIWRRYFFPLIASAQFRVASLVLVGAAGYYIVSRSTGIPPDLREASQAPEARESAPLDQKAFAPPPPAGPAPAPPPPLAAAPALDERKHVPPPAPRAAGPAANAAMAPAVASADLAAQAASEAAGSAAPAGASAPAPVAAPPPRLSEAAPTLGAAAGTLRAREAAKAERAAPVTAIRLLVIRIDPFEPSGFPALIERELRRAGVDIVPAQGRADGHSMTARLESRRLPDLLDRLARIGSVREEASLDGLPPLVNVTIRW